MTSEVERFERVAAAHRPAILRLCRHFEAAPEARRDLEQEILVGLWRALGSFRGDSSEKTFVLRIAHNIAVSHVARSVRSRSREALAVSTSSATQPAPDVIADQRAAIARVETRLKTLDLASQQLVLLALEGCTTAEIAEVTGLSSTNVTTRLHRLRKTLTDPPDRPHRGEQRRHDGA